MFVHTESWGTDCKENMNHIRQSTRETIKKEIIVRTCHVLDFQMLISMPRSQGFLKRVSNF